MLSTAEVQTFEPEKRSSADETRSPTTEEEPLLPAQYTPYQAKA